jgi:hypothetical protein
VLRKKSADSFGLSRIPSFLDKFGNSTVKMNMKASNGDRSKIGRPYFIKSEFSLTMPVNYLNFGASFD